MDSLLLTLLGVGGPRSEGMPVGGDSVVRSSLLPARRRVRLGEASARASFKKVGRALKEVWEAMS